MLQSILAALLLSMDFEGGYIPQTSSMAYRCPEEYSFYVYNNAFFTYVKPRVNYKGFYAQSGYTVFMAPRKGVFAAKPYRGIWDFEAGYTFNAFTIKYAHNCGHSIVTTSKPFGSNVELLDASYDKISIGISFSNKSRLR